MGKTIAEKIPSERLRSDARTKVITAGKLVSYDMKADRNDPTAVSTAVVAEATIKK